MSRGSRVTFKDDRTRAAELQIELLHCGRRRPKVRRVSSVEIGIPVAGENLIDGAARRRRRAADAGRALRATVASHGNTGATLQVPGIRPSTSSQLAKLVRRTPYLSRALRFLAALDPNLRGAALHYPGEYYSPLIDIREFHRHPAPHDGPEMWENVNLREDAQRHFYVEALSDVPRFPTRKSEDRRYFLNNTWFEVADAFALRAMIRREHPRRIVEVGSGFSSAVMLDTVDEMPDYTPAITFIEPYPQRLQALLRPTDPSYLIREPVQDVDLSVFEALARGDVLFIDSSHVAKVGSDVTFLLLRVLPRLKPGVFVHFHDVSYPHSYPADWIAMGRAWNESLFLRAFLVGNSDFEIVAFNSFAAVAFAGLIRPSFPQYFDNTGGSIWLRRV